MNFSAQVSRPDQVEVTITMTLTLGDWKKLKEQQANDYPGWKLSEKIWEVVRKVEAQVRGEVKPE